MCVRCYTLRCQLTQQATMAPVVSRSIYAWHHRNRSPLSRHPRPTASSQDNVVDLRQPRAQGLLQHCDRVWKHNRLSVPRRHHAHRQQANSPPLRASLLGSPKLMPQDRLHRRSLHLSMRCELQHAHAKMLMMRRPMMTTRRCSIPSRMTLYPPRRTMDSPSLVRRGIWHSHRKGAE